MALTPAERRGLTGALLTMALVLGGFAALILVPDMPLYGSGQPTLSDGRVILHHAVEVLPAETPVEAAAHDILAREPLLVVESTGAGKSLLISSRDAENPALAQAGGLGEVVGAEAICLEDDFDLSSALFEVGLPAVRVATRPVVKADEADDRAPDPALHAAATTALVDLIRRLSDS